MLSCSDTRISHLFQSGAGALPSHTLCMCFVQGTLCKARTECEQYTHRCKKEFLIGGGVQFETTHRVVSNLYENLGGGTCPWCPPIPTPVIHDVALWILFMVRPQTKSFTQDLQAHQAQCTRKVWSWKHGYMSVRLTLVFMHRNI